MSELVERATRADADVAAPRTPARQPAGTTTAAARTAGLRLALVGPLPPPAGGMANQTVQLARLLSAEGVAVEIVQVNRPYVPAWAGRLRGVRALFRLVPYLVALWRACGRCDVVHVMANSGWSWHLFAAPAVRIAAWRGRPVVVNYRGGEAATFLARAAGAVRSTLRSAQALVVPSGFLQHVFAGHGVQTRIVPNIVDTERFAPARPAAAAAPVAAAAAAAGAGAVDPIGPRLVVTRNLEPIYDIATALRAFARILERQPRATLAIAGTGPERAALEALAHELGVADRVRFTGRLAPNEVAALCAAADVMLNPARVDNMPNSVLEALAAGVPVVSTNVGGVPFIVAHGETALLVPPGDAEAMASAALAVLDDAALRERLRRNGRAAVEQYTWPRVGPQWLALYAELRGESRGARTPA